MERLFFYPTTDIETARQVRAKMEIEDKSK
jgi:hypothetical protein